MCVYIFTYAYVIRCALLCLDVHKLKRIYSTTTSTAAAITVHCAIAILTQKPLSVCDTVTVRQCVCVCVFVCVLPALQTSVYCIYYFCNVRALSVAETLVQPSCEVLRQRIRLHTVRRSSPGSCTYPAGSAPKGNSLHERMKMNENK